MTIGDYLPVRCIRETFRSPSQATLLRKRRDRSWLRVWRKNREASSTTPHLVVVPLLAIACFIRSSSMSILVRMAMCKNRSYLINARSRMIMQARCTKPAKLAACRS